MRVSSRHASEPRIRRDFVRPVIAGLSVALLVALGLVGTVVEAPSAQAVPPFPISDPSNGTPGATDPNWSVVRTGNTVGDTYTSDGWLRLTDNGGSEATNILNNTAFPSSTGFQVVFDFRQAGGTAFDGLTGDGIAMYLVDGSQSVSAGAAGSGLGYARGTAGCGVKGGYLGLGLDVFGNYESSTFGSFGGPSPALTNTNGIVGLRGSGPGDCTGAANTQYPWVKGTPANLFTGIAGNTGDPSLAASTDTNYIHAVVTVVPAGANETVTIALSPQTAKGSAAGVATQVLTTNLSAVAGQVALPSTLKLGFSASSGAATDYHDIRNISITSLGDAAITKALSSTTTGHTGYPAGTFLPGDPISFTLKATNNGPTTIGNEPTGLARVFDNLSSLPITGVTWTCSAAGGAVCDTGPGSGSTVSENWDGPQGGTVTVTVSGTVTGRAGSYLNTAVIPTNLTNNTVDPTMSNIQLDGGLSDINLTNNTATAPFTVVAPNFTQTKTANQASYAVGQPITYTVTVTNTGGAPGAATVSDPVPATVAVTSVSCVPASGATCTSSNAGNAISGTVTAPAGGVAVYTIKGTVIAAGTATNTATIAVTTPDCTATCGGGTARTPSIATVTPSLLLAKSASVGGAPTTTLVAGQTVTYDFAVTNTGQFEVDNVAIDEGAFTGSGTVSAVTCPASTLAIGASEICTATYTVTQADVDAGVVHNTATAQGNAPGVAAVTLSNSSTATLTAAPAPQLTLVKQATSGGAIVSSITLGKAIKYSFVVTNSGNVTMSNISIADSTFSGHGTLSAIACASQTLAPAASETCTANYVVTQADVDAGFVTNTATAMGFPPASFVAVSSSPSTVVIPSIATPALALTKTATPSTVTAAGTPVSYSFQVTNIGNVTLSGVSIADTGFSGTGALSAVSCPSGAASLAPGISITCTAGYVATQADVDAGRITNTATATGTPPTVNGVTPAAVTSSPSTATVSIPTVGGITIVKTATPSSITSAGDQVHYSFLVTNTGNVTLTAVQINEGVFSGTGNLPAVTCPVGAASLAPGASVTCTTTYVATQADVDAGAITNSATGSGTPPGGGQLTSTHSAATVTIAAAPSLNLAKTVTESQLLLGETLHYTYAVTNTGNVTMSAIDINETAFTGHGTAPVVTCPGSAATLEPGATVDCSATYVVSQADVDAGTVSNTATASAKDPGGDSTSSSPSTAAVPGTPQPALSLTKAASPSTVTAAGQTVTYSFLITNTGNLTISNAGVDEGSFTGSAPLSAVDCPAGAASLAPGGSVTCTATYIATGADIDAGGFSNTATATGMSPVGPIASPSESASVTATPLPALKLVKSVDHTELTLGEVLNYSFLVVNTGNVTVHDVAINEGTFTGHGAALAVSCPSTGLAVGAQENCTASYTVVQADVDAGTLDNTAAASGTSPAGSPVVSSDSTASVPSTQSPALSITKSASPSVVTAAGQRVDYTFVVSNTGNVTISGLSVGDSFTAPAGPALAVTCPVTSLAPGASTTCTADYLATQADIDNGSIRNSATVTGTPPTGPTITSPSSTATVTVDADSALSIVKSGHLNDANGNATADAGETVAYSFVVTNTGDTTMTDVDVHDSRVTGLSPAGFTLVPGASQTVTADPYLVTQADLDAQTALSNTATAHGTDPSGDPVISPDSTVVVPVTAADPDLHIVKHAQLVDANANGTADVGEIIDYSFVVTNDGNITAESVGVVDPHVTGLTPTGFTLAPGASQTVTADPFTVTQADIDAGVVANSATASATTPAGATTPSNSSTANVPTTSASPSLALVKTAALNDTNGDHIAQAGETISYTFVATNTGNVTLTNVAIADAMVAGITPGTVTLLPGASATFTADPYTVTAAEAASGVVSNTATATGTDPGDATLTSDPSTATVPAHSTPPVSPADPTAPSGSQRGHGLAFTGVSAGIPIGVAALLLLLGVLVTVGSRRRRA